MTGASTEAEITSRRIRPARRLAGCVTPAGDKSISHRALILAAAATGTSRITGLSTGADVESTRRVLRQLGVTLTPDGEALCVTGVGRQGFGSCTDPLDCGNSGTTLRLLAGLLAGTARTYTLTGDDSLRNRPMERVAGPLREMGIEVELAADGLPPLRMRGGSPRALTHTLALPSAQVKSAIILAALSADGRTRLHEPVPSRDHTEIMLAHLGAGIKVEPVMHEVESNDPRRRQQTRRTDERMIHVSGPSQWSGAELQIPGDISSAAYFVAAALLVRKSDVRIRGISANPTRTGLLQVLTSMGASAVWQHRTTQCGEPVGDLKIEASSLAARKVSGRIVPRLIDELPVFAVLATQAHGTTVVRDAGDLRHKESNRLERVAENLRRMGARIGRLEDGWVIEGPTALTAAEIETGGDHRVAMAFTVAGLIADGETEIDDPRCVDISCPGFFDMLDALR